MKVSNIFAESIYTFIFVLFVFCSIKFFSGNTKVSFQTVYNETQYLSFPAQALSDGSNSNILPIIVPSVTVERIENVVANMSQGSEVKGATTDNSFINSINEHRVSNGKKPLETDNSSCSFAATRSNEISLDFSHSGFDSRKDSSKLPYDSWTNVVENMAMSSSSGGSIIEMWKNSPVHNANLLSDITFGCVQNKGNYYVFEGWKN